MISTLLDRRNLLIWLCGLAALLTGCNTHSLMMTSSKNDYVVGDLGKASDKVDKYLKRSEGGITAKDRSLILLEHAMVHMAAGHFGVACGSMEGYWKRSIPLMESVADIRLGDEAGNLVLNQAAPHYWSHPRELVMASAMHGLAALLDGDFDEARVAFARAEEWRNDAVMREDDRKRVEMESIRNSAEYDQKNVAEGNTQYATALANKVTFQVDSEDYPDYTNPFACWLSAIFRANQGTRADMQEASRLLGRAIATTGGIQAFEADARWLSQGAARPVTWFVEFAGFAPEIETAKVSFVADPQTGARGTFGFPYLAEAQSLPTAMQIRSGTGNTLHSFEEITRYDTIFATEFQSQLSGRIAREVVRGTIAAIANAVIQRKSDNAVVSLVANVSNILLAESDERSWRLAPARVRLARVPGTPQKCVLKLGGGRQFTVPPAVDCPRLVVILRTTPEADPIIHQCALTRN